MSYKSETQKKNLAWFLPRPKKDHYKGGMPLYCEEWLLELAKDILGNPEPTMLNLFCGMNKFGFRIDIKPEVEPDLVCDAHSFASKVNSQYDVILADPPYSNQEAKDLYGTPKLNYSIWSKECIKVLAPKGLLIVFHKHIKPNPNPEIFTVVKRVFVGNRSNHLLRAAIFFQRK